MIIYYTVKAFFSTLYHRGDWIETDAYKSWKMYKEFKKSKAGGVSRLLPYA